MEVVIGKEDKKISQRQRGYYWSVIVPIIAKASGHSKDEVHEILQAKFFLYYNEEGLPYIQSMGIDSNWPARELAEKIEEIRRWSLDFWATEENPNAGYIPEPNEVDYD